MNALRDHGVTQIFDQYENVCLCKLKKKGKCFMAKSGDGLCRQMALILSIHIFIYKQQTYTNHFIAF